MRGRERENDKRKKCRFTIDTRITYTQTHSERERERSTNDALFMLRFSGVSRPTCSHLFPYTMSVGHAHGNGYVILCMYVCIFVSFR